MTPRRVLLVGHRTSHEVLGAARDLGLAGWEVHVATGARRSLAGASRFVRTEHRVTAPDVDLTAFTQDVRTTILRCGAEVVIGCGDPELVSLSAVRDALPAAVPLAPHPTVLGAVDKLTLVEAAVHVGLAVPHTETADEHTVAAWRGPAVVKPRLHLDPARPGTQRWTPTTITQSPDELARAVRSMSSAGRVPVLQEPIDGELIAVSAVRSADGHLRAIQQQRATRTWPPRTGVSSAPSPSPSSRKCSGACVTSWTTWAGSGWSRSSSSNQRSVGHAWWTSTGAPTGRCRWLGPPDCRCSRSGSAPATPCAPDPGPGMAPSSLTWPGAEPPTAGARPTCAGP